MEPSKYNETDKVNEKTKQKQIQNKKPEFYSA